MQMSHNTVNHGLEFNKTFTSCPWKGLKKRVQRGKRWLTTTLKRPNSVVEFRKFGPSYMYCKAPRD